MNRTRMLVFVALLLSTPVAGAVTLTGRVVTIADGDTLNLQVGRQSYPVRLAAIDAPERYQAWGERSKTHLSRLTINQMVVAECQKTDRLGHHVCRVTVNAMDVGLEQIRNGMAWWYGKDARALSAEDQSVYQSAELMAKLRRLGLWSETNPVPPWEFRGEP